MVGSHSGKCLCRPLQTWLRDEHPAPQAGEPGCLDLSLNFPGSKKNLRLATLRGHLRADFGPGQDKRVNLISPNSGATQLTWAKEGSRQGAHTLAHAFTHTPVQLIDRATNTKAHWHQKKDISQFNSIVKISWKSDSIYHISLHQKFVEECPISYIKVINASSQLS